MQNKSDIVTPKSSLKSLVNSFDQALAHLDTASEDFVLTVLNLDEVTEDVKSSDNKEEIRELMELLENYALMSGFLVDHPLLSVIKKIRDESKLKQTDPPVMAIENNILEGQFWKHYKGTTYKIASVAKNANVPTITDIHYVDQVGNTWALPIHEFIKTVTHEGQDVYRFTLAG